MPTEADKTPPPAAPIAPVAPAPTPAVPVNQNEPEDLIPAAAEVQNILPFDELTMLVFGEPGTGKTSFFAGNPSTLFLGTEPGQDFVKARIRPITDTEAKRLGLTSSWNVFQQMVRVIYKQKASGQLAEKGVKGVTIDIVDNLYTACLNSVCHDRGIEYPPENDFGKSWKAVGDEWRLWMKRLMECVNVNYVTHCTQEKIEIELPSGIKKEVGRFQPTFKGNKAAQYLDGIVNAMGWIRTSASGVRTLTFVQTPTCAAKDRTGILEGLGEITLSRNGWLDVESAYNARAKELGLVVKSKW